MSDLDKSENEKIEIDNMLYKAEDQKAEIENQKTNYLLLNHSVV